MNICEHLTETAKRSPHQLALIYEGHQFTYAELESCCQRASAVLAGAGVKPGERVAIMLPNVPAFVIWYYATLRLGAIAVSISTRLAEQEVLFVLADCEAKLLVTGGQQHENLSANLPKSVSGVLRVSDIGDVCNEELLSGSSDEIHPCYCALPNEPALILYTSGTTGFAKGATLSHANVRSNVLQFNHLCDMRENDRILLAVPLFHCFGQNALLNSGLNVGATLVLQRGFDIEESKRLIVEHRVTQLYVVPTMFQLFLENCAVEDLQSVRYCFSAAAKLPEQVSLRWLEKFGQPIYEGYGLTETSPFASYNHHEHYITGSIGVPIGDVEMKILNGESNQECPAGELGEIAISGPNVMLGYWNRPEETKKAIKEGWFFSGDIGYQDDNGYFYIVDRVKDMIVVGGLKVYPAEVERILFEHEAISDVAVVGFPDEIFGEQVVAFVVVPGSNAADVDDFFAEVQKFCQANLANFKVPKQFIAVDEIPRNPSGKILKTKLREFDLKSASSPQNENASTNQFADLSNNLQIHKSGFKPPTLWMELRKTHSGSRIQKATEYVQETVRVMSGSDEIPEQTARCLELGLDSLMIVELSNQLQAEIGAATEIPATLVFDYPRICDLAEFLVETFETAERKDNFPEDSTSANSSAQADAHQEIRAQIETMTEDEALEELMRELESS